jgi:hypothetical protein
VPDRGLVVSELVSWLVAHPERWVVPAVLVAAVAGTGLALWWERVCPSSWTQGPEHRAAMEAWRARPVSEQAAVDEAVLNAEEAAAVAAREAAERAVGDAARTGSLYR